jgi:hypothetical protein
MLALAGRLRDAGQVKEAEVWYRRAADTGSPEAMRALADWLANTGQAREAEHSYRATGQTGNP